MHISGRGVQLVCKGEVEPRDTSHKAARNLTTGQSNVLSCDYFFFGAKNRINEAELEKRGDSPVFVTDDGVTTSIFADLNLAKRFAFPRSEKVVTMEHNLGYRRVVLRCHNQPPFLHHPGP